jgi:hypothetical protein
VTRRDYTVAYGRPRKGKRPHVDGLPNNGKHARGERRTDGARAWRGLLGQARHVAGLEKIRAQRKANGY